MTFFKSISQQQSTGFSPFLFFASQSMSYMPPSPHANPVALLLQPQKQVDRFPTVLLRRDVQRRVALLVWKKTGAVGQELPNPVNPPQLTGHVQRRRAVLVRRVHIRAVVVEILDQVRRLRRDGDDQRLVSKLPLQTSPRPTTPMLLLMSKPPIT